MAQRPECKNDLEGQHVGFDKTGETSTHGGQTFEIWRCECGGKTLEVKPGRGRRDW